MRFILHWLTLAVALVATGWCLPGVTVEGWMPLLVGSLVLGLLNATVRPVLQIVSLPITLLTLGLFALVVNGVSFGLAAWLVPGFAVDGVLWAIVGALVFSLLATVIGWFTEAPARHRARQEREGS
jgi:putative membrane protein